MIKIAILLCFAGISIQVHAQMLEIDSLKNKLEVYPNQDTVRLQAYNDLAYYYQTVDPAEGLKIADSAISLAVLLQDSGRLASAFNYKGLNYASQGRDSLAVHWQEKCFVIRKQRNEKHGEAAALHNMGISYANMADYDRALDCQRLAYRICKALDDKYSMAAIINSIGVVYLFLSDYPRALDYYFQALHIYEAMKDTLNMGTAYTNIGLVYRHASAYKKSLDYQKAALEIFKDRGNEYSMQNTLTNMGNVYSDSGDITKALTFYHQALKINKKLENRNGIASCLMNTGAAYYGIGELVNANNDLQQALVLYRELKNEYGAGQSINYLVKIYLNADDNTLRKIGTSPSERFTKALQLQREGIQMGLTSGNLEIQRDGWENMSVIYSHHKEFAGALDAFKKHITLRDSIFNNDKKAEITRLSMQYAFDKKATEARIRQDKDKALSIAAINRQRIIKNGVMGGASILLVMGAISFILYKRKRDAKVQQKEAELRAEVADTEMKALRAQMNPHFIFNSLNSISDFIYKHETQTADYYLTKFAALMRMILENSEQKEIPLADDLKALELYMQLEALRMNHKFDYYIDIADNIDTENILVPPLLLQPFVENSIWHGIAEKQGAGKIFIEIKREDDMISCVIEDNGVGLKRKQVQDEKQKSLGMKITSSRIELLNRIKKANATLKLSNIAGGMRVEMKLPLILSF